MDQQNNNQQAQVPVDTQAPAVPQAPVAVPPTPAPEKPLVKGLAGLREKFNSLPKNTKLLVIVVGISVALIILLLIVGIIIQGGRGTKVVAPSPTSTTVPTATNVPVEISNPSKYATDSGVLKIESDVDNLTRDMSTVDLKESDLRVPTLDFNIKFK